MATERLARFFGLSILGRFEARADERETAAPADEPRSIPRARRVCGSAPATPVEPELPSLEAELTRLDGRAA